MASEALVTDSVDPLSELTGPSLFPRSIRASADVAVLAGCKDLDSVHNFMKSLELRNPEKLMNEAKKILDSGAEFLESNLASFAENMGISNAVPAKAKDRPKERRPGLGLARKRAPFSLRTTTSQPSVSLETTMNLDNLEDPDDFFDAFERMERANKEIRRQLGISEDNSNIEPSNNPRPRRQGILGRTYTYRHRYPSSAFENADTLILSQDSVNQDISTAPNVESQEKLTHPNPNPDVDIEDEEPDPNPDVHIEDEEQAVPIKKVVDEDGDFLEELLSRDNEDLEGDGAFNILRDWLNIKPLEKQNPYMSELTDDGKSTASDVEEYLSKSRKSSILIDSMKENLNWKTPMGREVANPVNLVSLPTPPKSPFASFSELKKNILQPSPLKDPFSPLDVDLSASRSASRSQPKDVSLPQIDNTNSTFSNMDVQADMGNEDSLLDQFVDENVSIRSTITIVSPQPHPRSPVASMSLPEKEVLQPNPLRDPASPMNDNLSSHRNAFPGQPKDKLLLQVDASKDLGMSIELESRVEVDDAEPRVPNVDVQEVMQDEDSCPQQSVDENVGVSSRKAGSRPHEEESDNIEKTANANENEPNPSALENDASDGATSRKQTISENQSQEHQAKLQRVKRGAGYKRVRKFHPMRKSLAEAGTSFETGLRRSKRIKMRPLEYWKGERFLYGHMNDSLKLLGVKYMSPGKGNEDLKVKPYISSETSEFKELLDLAASH